MPQLDPTWFASQLFWLAVFFVALYFMLSRWALPQLMATLENRERTKLSDIENAQTFKSQAEEARLTYERALSEARGKAQQLFIDAAAAHKANADKASRELDAQIARRIADAETRIQKQKQELIANLQPTAEELAGIIVEKLTRHSARNDRLKNVVSDLSKTRTG